MYYCYICKNTVERQVSCENSVIKETKNYSAFHPSYEKVQPFLSDFIYFLS